ncbi:hypothetical protein EK904_013178 [Melospiza melodia maxima]|nr:hypothetical protein EK904_013178 [Melospiza melodia maxima]
MTCYGKDSTRSYKNLTNPQKSDCLPSQKEGGRDTRRDGPQQVLGTLNLLI